MRTWPAAVLVAGALLAGGCDRGREEAPLPDLAPGALLVRTPAEPVDFGALFALEVLRAWPGAGPPPPWDPQVLAPLVVEPLGVDRWPRGGRVLERRRLRARAFVPGPVALPGGARLEVRSCLPPGPPGPPEPPPAAPAGELPWRLTTGLLALLAGLLLLGSWLRSRPARPDPPGAPATPLAPPRAEAGRRARARLQALAARRPGDAAAMADWHRELADLLRDFLAEAHGVPARRRTSEELQGAPAVAAALGEGRRESLAAVLLACDRVRFGRHLPPPEARAGLLAAAAAVLGREEEA